ncbi:hypothetical protein BDP27DRAFT_1342071 [Rhodocollybia butyracea]|uniref:Uncharacterized protein n=1 Tax=Rhodocollybia butyracea TaxID=206335 RepID=A0A9P5P9M3_9AGAR|nr:hypothetical protein BDP27DRAFT_1342071 [Rhodocollybia butyracea]
MIAAESTERTEPEDSVITDFAFALFRSLGYTHRPLVACGPDELEFLSCGRKKSAALDLSIIDHNSNDIILVVQEDKQLRCKMEPQPQPRRSLHSKT